MTHQETSKTAARFELNTALEWLYEETTRVLGLGMAAVDMLFDGAGYKTCEVNSSLGFEAPGTHSRRTAVTCQRDALHIFTYLELAFVGGAVTASCRGA